MAKAKRKNKWNAPAHSSRLSRLREGRGRMGRRQHHITAVHTCTANKYAELTVSRFEHVIVSSSVARARADLARYGARDEC